MATRPSVGRRVGLVLIVLVVVAAAGSAAYWWWNHKPVDRVAILEANTRQRDAPPGAFWLCAFAWRPGANALPLGSNEPRSKEARCLNPFRSALAPS